MNKFVIDTMAYILYLERRKMPEVSKLIFQKAEKGELQIFIPAMVIAEIAYLSEKNRIDTNLEEVRNHLTNNQSFKEQILSFEIIEASFKINDIPELHDRLIGGTASFLNCKLITNDPLIEKSKFVKTIWKK